MGEKLVEIYEVVTQKAGFDGRMELAKKTGMSKNKAEKEEDSPDNITKFKEAASQIIGENIDSYLKVW